MIFSFKMRLQEDAVSLLTTSGPMTIEALAEALGLPWEVVREEVVWPLVSGQRIEPTKDWKLKVIELQ